MGGEGEPRTAVAAKFRFFDHFVSFLIDMNFDLGQIHAVDPLADRTICDPAPLGLGRA
jgi:hypothetical protein